MYVYPYLKQAQKKARKLGLPIPQSSQRKHKKLYVIYNNKEIHFGNSNYSDFLEHKDPTKRKNYRARASKILLNSGHPAYLNKNQPAYYSYRILW